MQENDAVARSPGLVEKVVDRIRNAKNNSDGIIVVDFLPKSMGRTLPEIWQEIGPYRKVAKITKNQYDGSREVIRTCRRHHFDYCNIEICGIHSEVCVADTARGLIVNGVRVTISQSAVADKYERPLSWTKQELCSLLEVLD